MVSEVRETAAEENGVQRASEPANGVSSVIQSRTEESSGTASTAKRMNTVVTPDAEGSLREAASQIERAFSRPDSSAALREASEAYQGEASAREAIAQQQTIAVASVNVMA
jgi:hypothetical protein